jgi:hypothetical protein
VPQIVAALRQKAIQRQTLPVAALALHSALLRPPRYRDNADRKGEIHDRDRFGAAIRAKTVTIMDHHILEYP